MMTELSDEELVVKSLSDPEFFSEIINRYEKRLFVYLKRFGFANKDLEDYLQDIFINVYKNLNGFDVKLKFSSWIYRIAHNYAISVYRKRKEVFELDDSKIYEISSKEDLFLELDKKYVKENVLKILNLMDLKYREVLFLKYFEDKDYSEISDILKKPIGTVSTLINRAKNQFKVLYKEKNFDN